MTRKIIGLATVAALAGLLAFDLAASEPLDPYDQPALLAWGSGAAAGGAHCASLPSAD